MMEWRDPVTSETLTELSARASPGKWFQGDIVEGQLIGQWQGLGPEDREAPLYAFMAVDANFICALVNAYRSGAMIDRSAAHQALRYGRDSVMESFDHVSCADDQVMADARLQAIDAVLAVSTSPAPQEKKP